MMHFNNQAKHLARYDFIVLQLLLTSEDSILPVPSRRNNGGCFCNFMKILLAKPCPRVS